MCGLIAETIPLPLQSNIWWFDGFCFILSDADWCVVSWAITSTTPRAKDRTHSIHPHDVPCRQLSFAKHFMQHESVFNFASVRMGWLAVFTLPMWHGSYCRPNRSTMANNGVLCFVIVATSFSYLTWPQNHRAPRATTHQKWLPRGTPTPKKPVINMAEVMCNTAPIIIEDQRTFSAKRFLLFAIR